MTDSLPARGRRLIIQFERIQSKCFLGIEGGISESCLDEGALRWGEERLGGRWHGRRWKSPRGEVIIRYNEAKRGRYIQKCHQIQSPVLKNRLSLRRGIPRSRHRTQSWQQRSALCSKTCQIQTTNGAKVVIIRVYTPMIFAAPTWFP